MVEHSEICSCGTMVVPLLLEAETDRKFIRTVYCPECVFYEFPNLNFFSKAYLIEASDASQDGVLFPLDYKTSACYSLDFGGFFAVRFDIVILSGRQFFKFNTPLKNSVVVLPQCFKCSALELVGWEEGNNGNWHLNKKCKYIFGRTPQSMVNVQCKNFERME